MEAKVKRKKKKTGLYIVIAASTIIFIVLLGIILSPKGETEEFTVEEVAVKSIVSSVSESGEVEPVVEVKIAADVSGEIVDLVSKEGELVKQGQILATIRPDNYESALDQARAALQGAQANAMNATAAKEQAYAQYLQDSANMVRQKMLFDQKVIPANEYENFRLKFIVSKAQYRGAIANERSQKFQVQSMAANLKNAQTELRKTTILASMDGTITKQNVKKGERVAGTLQNLGTELFRIADLSLMQVVVDINENDIIHIHEGDSARIEIDAYENKKFMGKVAEVAYSPNSNDLLGDQITSFQVKVVIDPASYKSDSAIMKGLASHESPFRPGMSAEVEIFTDRHDNVVAVPIKAVAMRRLKDASEEEDPVQVVFVMKTDGVVEMRPIETGIRDDEFIEITNGLSPGEKIVSGPYKQVSRDLEDGTRIYPQRK